MEKCGCLLISLLETQGSNRGSWGDLLADFLPPPPLLAPSFACSLEDVCAAHYLSMIKMFATTQKN